MNYLQLEKWATIFVFSMLIIISCEKTSRFEFSGTVVGEGIDSIIMAKPIRDSATNIPYKILDTIHVVNGDFKGEGELSGAELRFFMINGNQKKTFRAFVGGGEKTQITLYADSINKSKIEGSPTNDEFQELNDTINGIRKKLSAKHKKFLEDGNISSEEHSAFEKMMKEFEKNYDIILDAFIDKHKHDNLAAFGIAVKGKIDFEELTKSYEQLNESAKKSFFGKEIKRVLDDLKPFSVGSEIKDFTLANAKDSSFSLSSLKGKHVLLNFWMVSNAQSRELNKKLKNWYELYKGSGLEIVSLSIGNVDKEEWDKAIKEDQMSWIQVRDSIGSTLVQDYGVRLLPHQILIDPKGIIIKVVQGNDEENKMEAKLKEVFTD